MSQLRPCNFYKEPIAELSADESHYIFERLQNTDDARIHLITALAVEAKLSFATICEIGLPSFDFRWKQIYLPPCYAHFGEFSGSDEMCERTLSPVASFDLETLIALGAWMSVRGIPEDGIAGVLLHDQNQYALTPEWINTELRKLLCAGHPDAEKHREVMSAFNESYLANLTY